MINSYPHNGSKSFIYDRIVRERLIFDLIQIVRQWFTSSTDDITNERLMFDELGPEWFTQIRTIVEIDSFMTESSVNESYFIKSFTMVLLWWNRSRTIY